MTVTFAKIHINEQTTKYLALILSPVSNIWDSYGIQLACLFTP